MRFWYCAVTKLHYRQFIHWECDEWGFTAEHLACGWTHVLPVNASIVEAPEGSA